MGELDQRDVVDDFRSTGIDDTRFPPAGERADEDRRRSQSWRPGRGDREAESRRVRGHLHHEDLGAMQGRTLIKLIIVAAIVVVIWKKGVPCWNAHQSTTTTTSSSSSS